MPGASKLDPEMHGIDDADEPPLVPRLPGEMVPLTFRQQAELRRLGKVHRLRTCVTAVRIAGKLDICRLRRSLSEVVTRHDSLRTRIVEGNGVVTQELDDASRYELSVIDLSALSPGRVECEAQYAVDEFAFKEIDVESGPLFASRLIGMNDREHVLVLSMDHVIADGFSTNVLSRDLWTLYSQNVTAGRPLLPQMSVQFPDYAIWQQRAFRWWLTRHGGYWERRLTETPRVPFPIDGVAPAAYKMASVSGRFGRGLCNGLRTLSRRQHCTLPIAMLAAYAATILRWQGKWELIMRMASHGRIRRELRNMIGCISSAVYLRIELRESDTFLDFLRRVSEEVYTAYEHHTLGYIAVRCGEDKHVKCAGFNWIPPSLHVTGELPMFRAGAVASADELRVDPFPVGQTAIAHERNGVPEEAVDRDPILLLWESRDGVLCCLRYEAGRFKSATMERFLRNFHVLAEELLERPQARVVTRHYK